MAFVGPRGACVQAVIPARVHSGMCCSLPWGTGMKLATCSLCPTAALTDSNLVRLKPVNVAALA